MSDLEGYGGGLVLRGRSLRRDRGLACWGAVPTACFWTWDSGWVELSLRRFTFREPCLEFSHSASVAIGRGRRRLGPDGKRAVVRPEEYSGDPRWPAACERCGSAFTDADERQVNQESIYRTYDGRSWPQRELPAGALYDAEWLPDNYRGLDGIALACVCPRPPGRPGLVNVWFVDGPATGGGRWVRSGDPRANPPTVSVTPSIAIGLSRQPDGSWAHGGPDFYHGFLGSNGAAPGWLTDPL